MKGVAFSHNFGFLRRSHTLHWRPSCNFEKWEKQLWRSLPGFDRRKVSLLERSKPKSTKIGGLMMFSEIGELPERKKFLYSSRGVCSKIMMFTVCKGWKTWTAFP